MKKIDKYQEERIKKALQDIEKESINLTDKELKEELEKALKSDIGICMLENKLESPSSMLNKVLSIVAIIISILTILFK